MTFIVSSLAVITAGVRLSRDGDAIADRTGLGAAWIGAILVAAATSLPELVTDVYAVLDENFDLAMGDLFGSSMANMLILALADLATSRHRILTRVAINQTMVAAIAISLTAIIVAGIVSAETATMFGIGWAPLMVIVVYVAGMRLLHINRHTPPFETAIQAETRVGIEASLKTAAIGFAIAALVILFAAQFLASSTADLADKYGVSQGFIGIALLAVTTSLPEAAVTIEAVRRQSYDLAVGNLLGSNCFNMVIFFALDIADGSGSILAKATPAITIGAMFAILLTAMTMMEILHKAERRIWLIEPDAIARIIVYGIGLLLVYRAGGL